MPLAGCILSFGELETVQSHGCVSIGLCVSLWLQSAVQGGRGYKGGCILHDILKYILKIDKMINIFVKTLLLLLLLIFMNIFGENINMYVYKYK